MKKVVLLVDTMSFGGSERSVQILVNNQNYIGNKLIIVSLANDWKYEINDNIKTYVLYSKNYNLIIKLFLLPITFVKLIFILKKIKPNIVSSYHQQSHLLNAFISKILNFNSIINERAYVELYYGKKNYFLKPIVRYLYNSVNLIVVNDKEIKESLEKFYHISSPIKILNNLLDVSNFNKSETGIKNDSIFKFITVGRLSKEKNTKDIIEAFYLSKLKNTSLIIIGDGPLKESLINLSKKLGIDDKVSFHGHQLNVSKYLSNSDVFVFSSLNEGFPNVILEAMHFGLPIISYKFKAGISTILDNGKYGILVPLGNVKTLADQMRSIYESPEKKEKFQKLSLKRIETFTDKNKFMNEFNKIINTFSN